MRSKQFNPQLAQAQAMQLFWAKGYAQTSMDELLKITGLSRSSFYNAFGDKRKLYERVLDQFTQLGILAYSTLSNDKSVNQALEDFFKLTFFSQSKHLDKGCLLVNTILEQQANDPELAQHASACLKKLEQHFTDFFELKISQGELSRKSKADNLSQYIMTLIKGLRVASREGASVETLQETLAIGLSIFHQNQTSSTQ